MHRLRRHLQRASLWLAMLLFAGQLFAVAHATQHELAAQGQPSACEICNVAHGDGGLPVSAAPPQSPKVDDLSFIALAPPHLARLAVERPRSRAPPVLI